MKWSAIQIHRILCFTEFAAQIIVGSMHERKTRMADRACGFVGLPGGFGTFEEVKFEINAG
jgi:predicted Rossmann-fold nucleotide-binding protein